MKNMHEYSAQGTNMGRVEVDVKSAGDVGDYEKGKGRIRVAQPWQPDRHNNTGNEGGYKKGKG